MKQITLSIRDFYVFKEIANFFYDITINKGQVIVEAEQSMLETLGY